MVLRVVKGLLVSAITAEARLALALHHPKIVAITGSLGKTSTKDAIFVAISGHFRARKSTKSFNSEIGVPLSILGCSNPWSNPLKWLWALFRGFLTALDPKFPELLVLEVGADRPNDISSVARWLRPHIAVFTGIPAVPVHVENFPSRDALVREKRSLFEHVREGGAIIANADGRPDEVLAGIAMRTVTYGASLSCDFAASEFHIAQNGDVPSGIAARVSHSSSSGVLTVRGALGKPRIYAGLAAVAVADTFGIALHNALAALSDWAPPAGRMRILSGKNHATIIDDSYNSSPAAVRSALETLVELSAKRRVAMLGDMLELGTYSGAAHREAGEQAAASCGILITVGERAHAIAKAAKAAGMPTANVREYGPADAQRAGEDFANELLPGDIVLVKGSQGVRMERAVRALMENPDDAARLLVRQGQEWSRR